MKFKVEDLIVRIQKERDTHQTIFYKAMEVYRQELLKQVEEYIKNIKQGRITTTQRLPVPEEHTKDFNTILDMLLLTVDEEIELNKSEFECYVCGNWSRNLL